VDRLTLLFFFISLIMSIWLNARDARDSK
jgi:hypothetical protein